VIELLISAGLPLLVVRVIIEFKGGELLAVTNNALK
jgi:hypothetical protein